MKKFCFAFTLLVLTGCVPQFLLPSPKPEPIACTLEAKLCPDGSAVGRTGPNCEFAPCPEVKEAGILWGKVSIGPICPVERLDHPCRPTPEMYTSRSITLTNQTGQVVKQVSFNGDGTYRVTLNAGIYTVDLSENPTIGGSKDLPKTVTITSGQETELDINIDTGIR